MKILCQQKAVILRQGKANERLELNKKYSTRWSIPYGKPFRNDEVGLEVVVAAVAGGLEGILVVVVVASASAFAVAVAFGFGEVDDRRTQLGVAVPDQVRVASHFASGEEEAVWDLDQGRGRILAAAEGRNCLLEEVHLVAPEVEGLDQEDSRVGAVGVGILQEDGHRVP